MPKIIPRIVGAMTVLAVGATLMTGSATSASADAGSAVAAGILGGAVGVMVGDAAARAAPPPPIEVYERPEPVYIEEALPPPECHMERRPVYDEDGDPAGSRPVRVCD
jgi:hypothetical protein